MRKATEKDYAALNPKTAKFADAIESGLSHADLKDHGGHAAIVMRWNLNADSERDRIFTLEINGEKAYIDLEELMSYTRLM